jgi:hypothetical protein
MELPKNAVTFAKIVDTIDSTLCFKEAVQKLNHVLETGI